MASLKKKNPEMYIFSLTHRLHIRATNMFSIGFMTLLHVVMDKVVTNFPSWDGALISIPRVLSICEPGTYQTNFTTTAYCQDSDGNIQKSIKCIQCPENMYTSLPNQDSCIPCEDGYYAPSGSSSCTSCYETRTSDNSTSINARSAYCSQYLSDQEAYLRRLFLAIFVPIGIVLAILIIGTLIWYFRKRFLRQRALGKDENWLLHFDDLVDTDDGQNNRIIGNDERISSNGTSSSIADNTILKISSAPIIEGSHITASTISQGDENSTLTRFSTSKVTTDQRSRDPEMKISGGERGSSGNVNTRRKGDSNTTGIKLHEQNKLIHTLGFQ